MGEFIGEIMILSAYSGKENTECNIVNCELPTVLAIKFDYGHASPRLYSFTEILYC
jgi:hypothetical protein